MSDQSPKIKPRAKSAAALAVVKKRTHSPEPLDEGDWIEYGNTAEVKTRSGGFWPKISVGGRIRPGETADEALERMVEFVTTNLAEQSQALK